MPLQVHPIALGCMLVVAVGTLIYSYVTTRQQAQPHHSYGPPRDDYEYELPLPPSRSSSRTSVTDDSRPPSRRRKNVDHCSICLGTSKSNLKTLTCSHVFHSHCITTWLLSNKTCPICRREVHI